MPKVSIIIPVYGVEKYIERCARSLFEQTLDDIEYLFIDDCTPDRSIEVLRSVLEEYPQRKEQVVIHRMEQNSGQAKVREWGMMNATGEYVIHCDSDDWVETDAYEKLYNQADIENADMVFCNYYEEYGTKRERVTKDVRPGDSNITLLKRLLCGKGNLNSLWSLLVSKELYNDIVYPRNNQSEDFAIVSQLLLNSQNRIAIPDFLYHYVINEQSISHNPNIEKVYNRLDDAVNNRNLVYQILKEKGFEHILHNEVIASKALAKCFTLQLKKEHNYKSIWNSVFPEVNGELFFIREVPFKLKCFHLAVQLKLSFLFK